MKKTSTLLVFILAFVSGFAQITFNNSDVPVAPWTQKIVKDTLPLPSVNYGNKGANQVYDFSNLSPYKYDTIEYRLPTSGQLANVTTADDAITNDGTTFLFTKTATNQYTLEGFQGAIAGNTLAAQYTTPSKIYQFPTVYGGNFSGTAYLQKAVPGSQVGQSVDQVRLTINTSYYDTIDGWGKVITPVGAYKCLRVKRKETTTTTTEFKLFSFSAWANAPGSPTTRTTIRYSYLTKETKGSVVTFEYDSVDNLLSASYSQILPNAPIADFSSTPGSNGSVSFTDLSDNYPTSWAWTFGDGGTSTQQNPSHTYAANGTYTVCLIATNAGGSSTQVCHQVVVNNVTVAPVAAFTWVNNSGGLVNFTDQSTNGPTTWAWTFGDTQTSTQQNPNHIYAANNTYNVCLTATNSAGSNQHCENVVVTHVSGVNSAPVATNDTASVLQPNGLIRNVGTNDADPNNDLFCITSVYGSAHFVVASTGNCTSIQYSPDSNFVGYDSCYYIICDNGTPILCDTGKFVVHSIANPALYPVAVNDAASFLQPTGGVVNVTANDSDPNGTFCINSIYGSSPAFTVNGCSNILFSPDSIFTGNDTVWYVICDNGHPTWCDTAMLVVTSNQNSALLPVANFFVDSTQNVCHPYVVYNTSTGDTGLAHWKFTSFNSVVYNYSGDSAALTTPGQGLFGTVCLYVSNKFGGDSVCRTFNWICEGISEISLSDIKLYPNPGNSNIVIDMSKNQDEITRNYAAIEIYNGIGEKVKVITEKNSRLVNVSVGDLPEGMYLATLLDAKGTRMTLGRFTINR